MLTPHVPAAMKLDALVPTLSSFGWGVWNGSGTIVTLCTL
jgi:hypothetical protein